MKRTMKIYKEIKEHFWVSIKIKNLHLKRGPPQSYRGTFFLIYIIIYIYIFTPHSISELAETHLETSLRSGRDLSENSRQPSQPGIQYLDHLLRDLMRELPVQL